MTCVEDFWHKKLTLALGGAWETTPPMQNRDQKKWDVKNGPETGDNGDLKFSTTGNYLDFIIINIHAFLFKVYINIINENNNKRNRSRPSSTYIAESISLTSKTILQQFLTNLAEMKVTHNKNYLTKSIVHNEPLHKHTVTQSNQATT